MVTSRWWSHLDCGCRHNTEFDWRNFSRCPAVRRRPWRVPATRHWEIMNLTCHNHDRLAGKGRGCHMMENAFDRFPSLRRQFPTLTNLCPWKSSTRSGYIAGPDSRLTFDLSFCLCEETREWIESIVLSPSVSNRQLSPMNPFCSVHTPINGSRLWEIQSSIITAIMLLFFCCRQLLLKVIILEKNGFSCRVGLATPEASDIDTVHWWIDGLSSQFTLNQHSMDEHVCVS